VTADAAHLDLEERLNEAREAYYAAMDAGQFNVADLAYAQLDRLLEQYQHLPLQRQAPTSVPVPPTTTT
jgi:hypothetical protein